MLNNRLFESIKPGVGFEIKFKSFAGDDSLIRLRNMIRHQFIVPLRPEDSAQVENRDRDWRGKDAPRIRFKAGAKWDNVEFQSQMESVLEEITLLPV